MPNGLSLIFEHKKGKAVVVEVMVRVGSNNEMLSERGISHFLEHILFEGTTTRPTNKEISNEIEKIGGDFNAYTTNERTCFYVKVLRKHFPIAVEILADILQNPLFRAKDIDKEKKVVIKEIDMVNDEPRYYQWVLLQKNLFEKHPSRYPTYGDKKVINSLNPTKVAAYFRKHYVPNNMVVSIVGDVKNWRKEIEQRFVFKKGKLPTAVVVHEPSANTPKERREKKKIANTYLIMGFKTVPRTHVDMYTLEVINGILGRGQSGRMFSEIRGKLGLAYEVGTQHIAEIGFGYFAVYATIDKKNITLVKKMMLEELEKLKKVSELDLQEAKDYIEGDYYLELEDGQKLADQILFWEQARDARLMDTFIKKIKNVSQKDVKRVVETYFKNYTLAVLEGK